MGIFKVVDKKIKIIFENNKNLMVKTIMGSYNFTYN